MSAICGLVNFDGSPVDPGLLRKMAEAAVHHAPDGLYYWIEGNVGLAYLAFNTTPETQRERQPLLSADGTVCLVVDGRIDNRPELIHTLSRNDFPTTSESTDADLILAAYQHWGNATPQHLVGDFAFAIWDSDQQKIFCAADLFGIKPLVYTKIGSLFCFATEARQILQHPAVPQKLDEISVADFLTLNNQNTTHTFFENIRYVPPGHTLTADSNKLLLSQYWDWPVKDPLKYTNSQEYVDQFTELFQRAIQDRLRTVMPTIGINLSGGLDSSSIAALAQELLSTQENRQLTAQTLIYDQIPFEDERAASQLIADYLGLDLNFIPNDDLSLIPENGIVDPESPYRAWEQTEQNLLEQFRHQGGQILLTGLGGDDLLVGSALVYADQLRQGNLLALGKLWKDAQTHNKSFLKLLYSWFIRPRIPQSFIQKQAGHKNSGPKSLLIPNWIQDDFAKRTNLAQRLQPPASPPFHSWARQVIYQSVTQMGNVYRQHIHWQSRLAVRHQIAYRHPFLDRRLCQFILRLPPEHLWHDSLSKYILRRAMVGKLPDQIRLNPRKTTYASVIHQRLRDKEAGQISQLLETPLMVKLGFVNCQNLHQLLDSYFTGRQDGRTALILIRLLNLEVWLLNYSF